MMEEFIAAECDEMAFGVDLSNFYCYAYYTEQNNDPGWYKNVLINKIVSEVFGFPYRFGRNLSKIPYLTLHAELRKVGYNMSHSVLKEDDWVERTEHSRDEIEYEKYWWESFFKLSNAEARQVEIRLQLDDRRVHHAAKDYFEVVNGMLTDRRSDLVKAEKEGEKTKAYPDGKSYYDFEVSNGSWVIKLIKPFEVKALFFLSFIAE